MVEHEHEATGHVPSRKPYFLVWLFLMCFTALTVWVAGLNLGPFNDLAAMVIAVAKGTMVVLFFMHVAHSSRLTKLTVLSGFVWLLIMISLTLGDYLSRGWMDTFAASR